MDSFRISISILGFYNLILYPKYFLKFQHYHFKQSHIILLKKYALFWLFGSCFLLLLLLFTVINDVAMSILLHTRFFFSFRINWYIIKGNKLSIALDTYCPNIFERAVEYTSRECILALFESCVLCSVTATTL